MKIFLLLLTITAYSLGLEEKCPKTDISPCTCQMYFDGACVLECTLAVQSDLDRLADIPNLCDGHVHFSLVNSKVSGIPAKLWKTLLSSKTVDISISYAGVKGLVPPGGGDIPEVHTSGAAVIKIDHSKVGQWDWKQLHKFHPEEELTLVIDDTPLPEISSDLSQIAGGLVHKVTIDSTGLMDIPDKLFANFDNLNSLSLQNNGLTTVSRSMMPKPANKLEFLHLNGNQLITIPGDLFSDMPALEVVYLRDNQLKSLPQELFQSISSKNLQRLDFVYNLWECDCKLMWILQNTKYNVNLGNCATPNSVAGKKVKDLPQLLDC